MVTRDLVVATQATAAVVEVVVVIVVIEVGVSYSRLLVR